MVLARALTFGGAVALATASASPWFSYDPRPACGWTCYSPLESGQLSAKELRALVHPLPEPSTAFAGLGPWISAVLVALVLIAFVAVARSVRGHGVPRSMAVAAALAAAGIVIRTATQPDAGFGRPLSDGAIAIEAAAYVGLTGAVAAALGVALLARRRGRLESPVG